MIRRFGVLILVVFLFLAMPSPAQVQSQQGLTILNTSVSAEFPLRLKFDLSARDDADIVDIRLRYTIDRLTFAHVTSEAYVQFMPDNLVDVSWVLEMVRIGGLPPGTSVEYWWVVRDAEDHEVQTAPSRLQFDDTRYTWRGLTEGEITLYWYNGDEAFAQELMDTAQEAMSKVTGNTGTRLEKPVQLYIYADSQDLKGAMIFPQEWTGGVAYTRNGVIAIGISPGNLDWGKGAISHELTHLVVHQITLNPYSGLPTWLDEGLAMYSEGTLHPSFQAVFSQAIADGNLITVRSLSSPFSAYAEESYLAYAQSYSLVKFLIDSYGEGKMSELLEIFRQGSTYDGSLENVYGFDMDGLNSRWKSYVTGTTRSAQREIMRPVLAGALAK